MGLCNATATFQRLLNLMLSDQTREYGNLILCYVDEILVATSTVDQHLERLQIVFAKPLGAGLKLKPKKFSFSASTYNTWGRGMQTRS